MLISNFFKSRTTLQFDPITLSYTRWLCSIYGVYSLKKPKDFSGTNLFTGTNNYVKLFERRVCLLKSPFHYKTAQKHFSKKMSLTAVDIYIPQLSFNFTNKYRPNTLLTIHSFFTLLTYPR